MSRRQKRPTRRKSPSRATRTKPPAPAPASRQARPRGELPATKSANAADNPGVIAPPPLIYAVPLVIGLIVHFTVGGMDMGLPPLLRWPFGLLAIFGGLLVIGLAIERFGRARTNPEPWKPATAVVTDGIYRFSRNPMYLGMALAYAGIAVVFDCGFTLALLLLAILVIDRGVIAREERYMEAKFGGRYALWKRDTRRWI